MPGIGSFREEHVKKPFYKTETPDCCGMLSSGLYVRCFPQDPPPSNVDNKGLNVRSIKLHTVVHSGFYQTNSSNYSTLNISTWTNHQQQHIVEDDEKSDLYFARYGDGLDI